MRTDQLADALRVIFFVGIIGALAISHALAADEAITTVSPLGWPSTETGLLLTDAATKAFIGALSGDRAFDTLSQISLIHRTGVTPGYEQAAALVERLARERGLEEVSREEAPSDGETKYFGDVSARLWSPTRGILVMTSPFQAKITSFSDAPISLARGSLSADIETELVNVGEGIADGDYANDVRGKIVLAKGSPPEVAALAISKYGAAGIVTSFTSPEFLRATRLPGDWPEQVGWMHLNENQVLAHGGFAFMISERRREELLEVMRRGPVRLRADIDARLAPGVISSVTGVIRGTSRADQEVLLTAHLDHYKPGANDNASGSATLLEVATAWEALIRSGKLPRPTRTIRFLWSREFLGFHAWLAMHAHAPVERIADVTLDMVGDRLETTSAQTFAAYPPDARSSYLSALAAAALQFVTKYNRDYYPMRKDYNIISVNGSRDVWRAQMTPFVVGSDNEEFAALGVPSTILFQWPDNAYHTNRDGPDRIDPTQLARAAFVAAAVVAPIAYTDDSNAIWLAQAVADHGRARAAGDSAIALESLDMASFSELRSALAKSSALTTHAYQREIAAVGSVARLSVAPSTNLELAALSRDLNSQSRLAIAELQRRAAAGAGGLAIAIPTKLNDLERRAQRLVPNRTQFLQASSARSVLVSAQSLPDGTPNRLGRALQAQQDAALMHGESALRAATGAELPAYYVDGHRSILDIRNQVAAEFGEFPLDALIDYFEAFEKAGAMTIEHR